jgi:hypothetical protein
LATNKQATMYAKEITSLRAECEKLKAQLATAETVARKAAALAGLRGEWLSLNQAIDALGFRGQQAGCAEASVARLRHLIGKAVWTLRNDLIKTRVFAARQILEDEVEDV